MQSTKVQGHKSTSHFEETVVAVVNCVINHMVFQHDNYLESEDDLRELFPELACVFDLNEWAWERIRGE